MRFKKQIIIVCLFTFLLVPFNKPKKTEASPLALPFILQTVGELVVMSGVTIATFEMLQHITQEVSLDFNLSTGKDINELYVINKGIQITASLVSSVNKVISSLPRKTTFIESTLENFSSGFRHSFTLPTESEIDKSISYPLGTYSLTSSHWSSDFSVGRWSGDNFIVSGGSYNLESGTSDTFTLMARAYTLGSTKGILIYRDYDGVWNETVDYNNRMGIHDYGITKGIRITGMSGTYNGYWEIPYSEGMYEKHKPETLPNSLPGVMGGGIGINDFPLDTDSPNYGLSFPWDKPLSNEDSGVKDSPKEETDNPDIPNEGDVPNTGDSVFDKFGEWLSSLLGSLFSPLVELLKGILDLLKGLVIPTEWISLDFSPLYFSFADKFPFSIPFDLINIFNQFNSAKKEPIFYVDMSGFSSNVYQRGEVGFELDLTKFDSLFEIIRFFTLVGFVVGIALKTRDIIKG